MRVDEIPQKGLSVEVRLPGQRNPPQRILVVEDDRDLLCLNTEMLVRSGYHADAAVVNGAVAWDDLQVSRYDLMITDHNMRELSGVELLKKLHAACVDLPVTMATGTLPDYRESQL